MLKKHPFLFAGENMRKIVLLVVALIILFFVLEFHVDKNDKMLYIKYTQLTKETRKQIDCLADNIYFEAGSESEKGKIAVALVTLNRVESGNFPKTICSVVKQKTNSVCQFSWYCEGKKQIDRHVYNQSREIALHVYANYEKLKDLTDGALYYHADYVNPNWHNLKKTTVIGRHIFYK